MSHSKLRGKSAPPVSSPGSSTNTIVFSRNDVGIPARPPSLPISLLEWERGSLLPTEWGLRDNRDQRLPPPCLGPPFAVPACLQDPEDTVSVSFQRNLRGDSAKTLSHMGAWTAGQQDPASLVFGL